MCILFSFYGRLLKIERKQRLLFWKVSSVAARLFSVCCRCLLCVCWRMSDNAESPTENQKDDPSIQHTATELTGASDEKKKSMVLELYKWPKQRLYINF